ncbi:hypothetical protein AAMO2058_000970200 [Amorphochlora amoebiformis]|eukprot:1394319-Amorphochlora_amoeboformis.AAC.3
MIDYRTFVLLPSAVNGRPGMLQLRSSGSNQAFLVPQRQDNERVKLNVHAPIFVPSYVRNDLPPVPAPSPRERRVPYVPPHRRVRREPSKSSDDECEDMRRSNFSSRSSSISPRHNHNM